MRRFFLILIVLSFLAMVLAQPASQKMVRSDFYSLSDSSGGDDPQLPEVIATNLPDNDSLIGIKPMGSELLREIMTRHAADSVAADSLGVFNNDRVEIGGDSIYVEESDSINLENTDSIDVEDIDGIDDDRTVMTASTVIKLTLTIA